jgi:hypothetical protein
MMEMKNDVTYHGLSARAEPPANGIPDRILYCKSLTPSEIEKVRLLSAGSYELNFPHLECLSEELAEVFALHTGELFLGGIRSLTESTAKILSGFRGFKLSLSGLTALDETVAETLSQLQCDALAIGTRKMSDASLSALLGYRKAFLTLGLETLSPAHHSLLKQRRHVYLPRITGQLEQLERIEDSPEHRKLLLDACLSSGMLDLSRWTELPLFAAEILGECKCFQLRLNGLTTIHADCARALSTFRRVQISLDGLTALSVEAAEGLSRGAYDLSLNGLKSLPAPVAHFLSRCKSGLFLNGLETLSEEASLALRTSSCEIHLMGLGTLSENAEKALAENLAVWRK